MRVAILAAVVLMLGLVLFGWTQPAYADLIDVRTRQLKRANDYKVRLSAVLWLAKQDDDRSIAALTDALESDSEKAVRRVAAKALGTLVGARTNARVRDRAVSALERAARGDRSSRVRRSAKRSLRRVAALRPEAGNQATAARDQGPAAHVFVHVDRPSMGKHRIPTSTRQDLQNTVKDVLRKRSDYLLSWKSGGLPTRAQLERARTRGWFVGATVSQLDIARSGGKANVQCAVTMRVNRWEGSDTKQRLAAHETASATGKGQIPTRNSKRSIELAVRDCVLAVAEQLTTKQVVPFLKQKNR